MDFRNKQTSTIYHVTDDKLICIYEKDDRFESVADVKVEEPKKKTTRSTKK